MADHVIQSSIPRMLQEVMINTEMLSVHVWCIVYIIVQFMYNCVEGDFVIIYKMILKSLNLCKVWR